MDEPDVTGEPTKGALRGYQRIEDTLGQGAVAGIIFLVGMALWMLFGPKI